MDVIRLRAVFAKHYLKHVINEGAHAVVVERLQICRNRAHADLVHIGEDLTGFKFRLNLLDGRGKLPSQLSYYDVVFQSNTLVTEHSQLNRAYATIPDWWGIVAAREDVLSYENWELVRPAARNPRRKSIGIAELLWTSEASPLVEKLRAGNPNRSRRALREQLASRQLPHQLGPTVASMMKLRQRWRATAA